MANDSLRAEVHKSKRPIFTWEKNTTSREQLKEALAQAAQAMVWADQATVRATHAEERTSHLEGILSTMVMRLNACFGADFMDLGNILADILAPTAPAPALASAPLARAPSFDDDDDVNLEDF
ncbi:hypothetical protein COCNU_10G007790 [Cocos nucifera]|uniref:Uncharacterized protein n=1 Tax=Cocos nucifera TaxID=13894 RepID=A0A8K0N7Y7_COCNU|nr:hypothetical protein COCNU_10G007790 [Cocos nucifera]